MVGYDGPWGVMMGWCLNKRVPKTKQNKIKSFKIKAALEETSLIPFSLKSGRTVTRMSIRFLKDMVQQPTTFG